MIFILIVENIWLKLRILLIDPIFATLSNTLQILHAWDPEISNSATLQIFQINFCKTTIENLC